MKARSQGKTTNLTYWLSSGRIHVFKLREEIADAKITSSLPHQTIEFDSPYVSWMHPIKGSLKDAEKQLSLPELNKEIHEQNQEFDERNKLLHGPNIVIGEPHGKVVAPEPLVKGLNLPRSHQTYLQNLRTSQKEPMVKGLNLPEPPNIFTINLVNIPEEPMVKKV